jgi:hypothetical protein
MASAALESAFPAAHESGLKPAPRTPVLTMMSREVAPAATPIFFTFKYLVKHVHFSYSQYI